MVATQTKTVQFNQGLSSGATRFVYEEGDEGWRPTFTELPLISFKNINGTLEERQALAKEVGAAFRDVGFLYAKDCPGITPELVKDTFDAILEFYEQPVEEKLKLSWDNSPAVVGYEGFKEARNIVDTTADIRESFIICDDMLDSEQNYPGTPPPGTLPLNQWPEKFPKIRTQLYKYWNQTFPLARSLLSIVLMALEIDEKEFEEAFKWPMWSMRCQHYLPRPVDEDTCATPPHDDYSIFTILNQQPGSDPCLEVLNLNGKWISAPALPEADFVINCGNYLERISNGRFVSTIHRVMNHTGRRRCSLPLFFSPNPDTVIGPHPSLVGPEGSKYDKMDVGLNYAARMFQSRRLHPSSVWLRENKVPAEEMYYKYIRYGVPKDESKEETK
ncbi:hypothetical protein MNV49_000339 [Pseudohyphozyma bogoriensis]|nr:hypothetical protein MNV49_000339 [Pseudohyphozyma bogoriensis]